MGCADWLLIFIIFSKSGKCELEEVTPSLSTDLVIASLLKLPLKTRPVTHGRWINFKMSDWSLTSHSLCSEEKNPRVKICGWLFSQLWSLQYTTPALPCSHVNNSHVHAHTADKHISYNSPGQIPNSKTRSFLYNSKALLFPYVQQIPTEQKLSMTHLTTLRFSVNGAIARIRKINKI